MTDAIGKARRFHRLDRFAAANDCDRVGFCDGSGHGHCAFGEGFLFKDAHRSVPENGSRVFQNVVVLSDGFRTDVECLLSDGKSGGDVHCLDQCRRFEIVSDDQVDGQRHILNPVCDLD